MFFSHQEAETGLADVSKFCDFACTLRSEIAFKDALLVRDHVSLGIWPHSCRALDIRSAF